MSDQKIEALELSLYEDYLEELEKKYYGGINKVLGEPWFTKTDAEEYANQLLEIILRFEGKVYLSKNAVIPKHAFQSMYPQYTKMLELKKKYDPEKLLFSKATRRLFDNLF